MGISKLVMQSRSQGTAIRIGMNNILARHSPMFMVHHGVLNLDK